MVGKCPKTGEFAGSSIWTSTSLRGFCRISRISAYSRLRSARKSLRFGAVPANACLSADPVSLMTDMGLAMMKVPIAMPPMMVYSNGSHTTAILPPMAAKLPKVAASPRTMPMIRLKAKTPPFPGNCGVRGRGLRGAGMAARVAANPIGQARASFTRHGPAVRRSMRSSSCTDRARGRDGVHAFHL